MHKLRWGCMIIVALIVITIAVIFPSAKTNSTETKEKIEKAEAIDDLYQCGITLKVEDTIDEGSIDYLKERLLADENAVVSKEVIIPTESTTEEKTEEITTENDTENTTEEIIESTTEITTEEQTTEEQTTEEQTEQSQTVQTYTDDDLYLMSHIIYAESSGCSDEHQLAVGSVLLNRVADSRFPNSLYDVIFQSGQYSCTWNGGFYREPDEQSINNAIYLLENGSQLPESVVWQSEFVQGNGVYQQIGNTYFCY